MIALCKRNIEVKILIFPVSYDNIVRRIKISHGKRVGSNVGYGIWIVITCCIIVVIKKGELVVIK